MTEAGAEKVKGKRQERELIKEVAFISIYDEQRAFCVLEGPKS